ncbi:MAG: SpoIID/LytB domain-containing protein [Candidatus Hydrothermales bacterium]
MIGILLILVLLSCAKSEIKKYSQVEKTEIKKIYKKKTQKTKEKKLKEPQLRVLIYEDENPIYISGTATFFAIDQYGRKYKFYANDILKFTREGNESIVYLNGKNLNITLPIVFYVKGEGYIKVQGKRFRGEIEIDPYLRVINRVKVEDYLKSVVPLEIGNLYLSSFEALKAQAVCARSYALRKYLEKEGDFFHLYSDTKDQVYGGKEKENEITNLAIEMTKGEVLVYKNEVVLALYHSTCGGKTANYDEVFPTIEPISYLKSVNCNFQGKNLCENSPYFRWKREFKRNEFIENLSINLTSLTGISFLPSDIIDFKILKSPTSERISELEIKTKRGKFNFKGFEIRKVVGRGNPLPSNFFDFKDEGDKFIILGRGFGHGVGLCQYGALSLAKKGVKYEHILKFYFKNTKIKKIY